MTNNQQVKVKGKIILRTQKALSIKANDINGNPAITWIPLSQVSVIQTCAATQISTLTCNLWIVEKCNLDYEE